MAKMRICNGCGGEVSDPPPERCKCGNLLVCICGSVVPDYVPENCPECGNSLKKKGIKSEGSYLKPI